MTFLRPLRHRHGERLVIDGAIVRLRADARARRISLRIDAKAREVVATAPNERRLAEAVAFARERSAWIASELARLPAPSSLAPGQTIEVLGQPCLLATGTGRARLIPASGEDLMRLVARDDERFAGAVVRVLKAEARRVLVERTAHYAERLSQPMPTVSVADARGRWGSCAQPRRGVFGATLHVGRIRYSWRLVLAPFEVMDYVVAHECAHLIEANHGPDFWALVEGLVGPAKPHRAWLRAHGARLQGFGEA